LLVVLVSKPDAQAVKCLPSKGCEKGQTFGKDCCKPPDCEVLHELNVLKAYVHVLSNPPFTNWLDASVEGTRDEEFERFHRELRAEMSKQRKKFAPCPPSKLSPPPSFYARPSRLCEIDRSLEEALRTSNSCAELVESEFKRAEKAKELCLGVLNKEPITTQDLRIHRRDQAQAQVDFLESKMGEYRRLCTSPPEAPTARRAVAAGVPKLKKTPGKKPPKKISKRAAKRRGK
jgi:hypothetical protein